MQLWCEVCLECPWGSDHLSQLPTTQPMTVLFDILITAPTDFNHLDAARDIREEVDPLSQRQLRAPDGVCMVCTRRSTSSMFLKMVELILECVGWCFNGVVYCGVLYNHLFYTEIKDRFQCCCHCICGIQEDVQDTTKPALCSHFERSVTSTWPGKKGSWGSGEMTSSDHHCVRSYSLDLVNLFVTRRRMQWIQCNAM